MPVVIRTGILHNPDLDDRAGEAVRRCLAAHSAQREQAAGPVPSPSSPRLLVMQESSVANDRNWIEDVLCRWCDEEELDLILTVGGTLPAAGPSRAQLMPEATLAVLERHVPGLPEAMRAYAAEVTELALLDRGVAGIRSRTLIVNLPGGEGPAYLFLEAVVHLLAPIIAHLHAESNAPRPQDEMELDGLDDPAPDEDLSTVDDDPTSRMPDESADDSSARGENPSLPGKLDAGEFAQFLKRPRQSQ